MSKNQYLVISRGQWDESAAKEDVQGAIDRFYAWYDRGLAQGRLKAGSRLENKARVVSRGAITDGPFTETKELIGGFWFIVADTLEDAAKIAAENPCLEFGLRLEVRPLDAARANVAVATNETPASWREGKA